MQKDSFYRGRMDEVRIWGYARRSQNIKRQMMQRLTGKESGLLHYWPFVAGTGLTCFDIAGRNNGKLKRPG